MLWVLTQFVWDFTAPKVWVQRRKLSIRFYFSLRNIFSHFPLSANFVDKTDVRTTFYTPLETSKNDISFGGDWWATAKQSVAFTNDDENSVRHRRTHIQGRGSERMNNDKDVGHGMRWRCEDENWRRKREAKKRCWKVHELEIEVFCFS